MKILTASALLALLLSLSFMFGCTGKDSYSGDIAAKECMAICHSAKMKGIDLAHGPCLSNEAIKDWVCDVAHSPRQDVDNNPNNQCPAFGNGSASHYVEVDSNCNLIKKN